jgi:hypothetical protein
VTILKYLGALLALMCTLGSAQAAGKVDKDEIQFMGDHQLNEIVGAKFKENPLWLQEYKVLAYVKQTKLDPTKHRAKISNVTARLRFLEAHDKQYTDRDVVKWIVQEFKDLTVIRPVPKW